MMGQMGVGMELVPYLRTFRHKITLGYPTWSRSLLDSVTLSDEATLAWH